MQVYFKIGDDLMENTRTIKRNLLIFIVFISVIGFVGYFIDRMTGHADYTNAGMGDSGTAGMGIWLISPLFLVIILRSFCGDTWKEHGYHLNIKKHRTMYLVSFLIYPVVATLIILTGLLFNGISLGKMNSAVLLTTLGSQIIIQFIKNFFEESLWRAYLTNQLLKLKLKDFTLYIVSGIIWWMWHLPYVLYFLTQKEINDYMGFPISRPFFFVWGFLVCLCWIVMYVEIFRITKSVWPAVIMHTMEDAYINPLLLSGAVVIHSQTALVFSLSAGVLSMFMYLGIGFWLRTIRRREEYSENS